MLKIFSQMTKIIVTIMENKMGFKLANINGKSSLVKDNKYYDIETISNGQLTSDPSKIINYINSLKKLYSKIDTFEPIGEVDGLSMGAPITNSVNCFFSEEFNFSLSLTLFGFPLALNSAKKSVSTKLIF